MVDGGGFGVVCVMQENWVSGVTGGSGVVVDCSTVCGGIVEWLVWWGGVNS